MQSNSFNQCYLTIAYLVLNTDRLKAAGGSRRVGTTLGNDFTTPYVCFWEISGFCQAFTIEFLQCEHEEMKH